MKSSQRLLRGYLGQEGFLPKVKTVGDCAHPSAAVAAPKKRPSLAVALPADEMAPTLAGALVNPLSSLPVFHVRNAP
jgi:hypothetical protein